MRPAVFADTPTSPGMLHIFGNEDMRAMLRENIQYIYKDPLPLTPGISVALG